MAGGVVGIVKEFRDGHIAALTVLLLYLALIDLQTKVYSLGK